MKSLRTGCGVLITGLVMTCTASGILAQSNGGEWQLVLKSGERYNGVLVAVTSDKVLLETAGEVRGYPRDQVLWMKGRPKVVPYGQSVSEPPRWQDSDRYIARVPLDERIEHEVESGLSFGSPFAIKVGYNIWYNKKPWALGAGLNVQAYRFTQVQLAGLGRWSRPISEFSDAFIEAGAGISLYQAVNGVNFREWQGWSFIPEEYSSDFYPVKQVCIGPGYRWDPGFGIAFSTKLQWQMSWYRLDEQPNATTFIEGRYFLGRVGLLGSFIF